MENEPTGLLTVPQTPSRQVSGASSEAGRAGAFSSVDTGALDGGNRSSQNLSAPSHPSLGKTSSFVSNTDSPSSPKLKRNDSFSSKLADVKKISFFGKKVAFAKDEDFKAVNASLKAELSYLKSSLSDYMDKSAADMQTVVAKVDANRTDGESQNRKCLMDAKNFAERCCGDLCEEITLRMNTMEKRFQGGLESLQRAVEEIRTHDLQRLGQRFDADLENLCAELCAQAAAKEVEQGTTMGQLEKTLGDVDRACKDHIARTQKAETDFSDRLVSFEAIQRERNNFQDASLANAEAKAMARIEQLATSMINLAEKVDDLNSDTRTQGQQHVESLRESLGSRLAALEDVTGTFEKSVAEAGSVPTRRVEWSIQNVSSLLSEVAVSQESNQSSNQESTSAGASSGHCRSWLSPLFHAAGAQNLQFELRLLRPKSPQGNYGCELCLWGATGLYLVCRLSIGDVSARITHSFDGESPCSTGRLCSISEQICFREDALRVSVEIIEAVTQASIECSLGDISKSVKYNLSDVESSIPDGSLTAQRYLNHGMLDLVQEEVNRMRSRMTRRIEWKLEQASMMLRCFPQGESLCSSTFMAAGLEGLQLIFYPSGYTGARDGYCSLFLFCPAGSTLRCWLSAGKQRREAARVSFEQPGFFGRTNFCRFENCVDAADDSVLLALEIEEAQQTEKQNLTHPSSSKHAIAASRANLDAEDVLSAEDAPEQLQSFGGCPPSQFDSVVKLQRVNGQLWRSSDGKAALADVQRLPSIWTSKAADKIGDSLEGFHKFGDMRQVKKPGSSSSARFAEKPGSSSSARFVEKPGSSSSARFVAGSVSSRTVDENSGLYSQHTATQSSFTASAQTSRSDFWKNMPLAPATPRASDRAYELDGSVPPRTPGRLPKYRAYA